MNTYLIVSETIYNIENKLEDLKNGCESIVTFNMNENSMDEVLEEASYLPMFNDKKCVIVKNAKCFGTTANSKGKDDLDKLLKYLENENKNTRLVFTLLGKADSKKKVYKILKENNTLFSYPTISKTEMKNELLKFVNKNGYKITDNSLWYILNNSLGNFDLAINELNKIMLYYDDAGNINHNDVLNLTAKTIEDNNFKVVDSIIKRDLDSILKHLEEIDILKVEPSVILALIYREFRLMLSVLIYEKNKYSQSDILENLKLALWQYNKVKDNLRSYNEREIKEEIVKLSNFDYQYKSGLINRDVLLITYIMDLCC